MNYQKQAISLCLLSAWFAQGSQQSIPTQALKEKEAKEQKVMASKSPVSEKEALAKYEKELLEKYQPTDRKCGPGITYESVITGHGFGDEAILDDFSDPAGFLSCLIAGKKQVALMSPPKLLDQQLLKLLKHKQIRLKPIPQFGCIEFLAFTPQGLVNATLLEMGLGQQIDSEYFKGYLLGYPDKDIFAFYNHSFEVDKKSAQDWIEEEGAEETILQQKTAEQTEKESKASISKTVTDEQRYQAFAQAQKTINMQAQAALDSLAKEASDKEALERYEKEFLAKYNPTPDRCRPSIRAGGPFGFIKVPDTDSLLWAEAPEEALACLLSGNKHIVELEFTKPLNPKLQQLLNAKQIESVVNPTNTSEYAFFTPRGRRNVALWLETKENIDDYNRYEHLHSLEYSDADIKADYLSRFYTDRTNTHDWIKEKTFVISQIMLNALRLPFMSSMQPSE